MSDQFDDLPTVDPISAPEPVVETMPEATVEVAPPETTEPVAPATTEVAPEATTAKVDAGNADNQDGPTVPSTIEEREGLALELEDRGLVGVSINYVEERKTLDDSNTKPVFGLPGQSFNLPFADMMYTQVRNGGQFGDHETRLIANYTPHALHSMRLAEKDSQWVQSLDNGGERVGTAQPRLEASGNIVKGNAALTLLRRASNLGTSLLQPLYHSGIYIEMSCPPDTDLINLDYRLAMERAAVGMSTSGLLLSATSSIFVRELATFALSYVTSTNVANLSDGMVQSLMDRIDPMDYPTLINTMLATMYPNGYPWLIECANPKCGHKLETRMHFSRMAWVDKTCLNKKQMDMLVKKRNSITDAEIAEYKAEFKLSDKRVVKFNDNVEIHLRTGSLSEYAESGRQWVEDIEKQQAVALSSYNTDAERKAFLDSHIQARAMRKYGHFVEKIIFNTDTANPLTIVDRATIVESLDILSANDGFFVKFQDQVVEFIEASTIVVVGYAASRCKACGTVDDTDAGRFRSIVPMPIDRIFFTLTRQKTSMLAMLEQGQ